MHLTAGLSLLPFRLVDKLGEGGMGEVWRAVDTTLDREVALKVLPHALAGDAERIARFEREARVLASLSHPNIAAVYGFPECTIGAERVRVLAMEYVRGEDLAAVIERGPLPVGEAIDAAKQIAAALEAAHDSGIIHRDLKPANVRRTPDGVVKVLDFGLAKALEGDGPASDNSATVTSAGRGTMAGVILGTASYMSPEQARGLHVDRRTDLWAFGCVLYELLTGTKAFEGETVTDVLANVVRGEPDWERLPAATPVPVRRLLRRCLEKDPKRRLRDAGDASLLLDDNPEDARKPPASTPRRLGWYVAAALLLAAVATGAALLARRGAPPDASHVTIQRVTFGRGMLRAARFAPDGHTLAYGAAWGGPPTKLYLVRTDSVDSTPLALPPSELLSISNSGEMAIAVGLSYAGWMGDGTLARTALLGGNPREIMEHVRAADWSPRDDAFAIVRRVDGFDQLEYPVGKVLYRTPGYIADIRIAPDGERVAFADHPVYADDIGDVAVVDRAGHKTTLASGFDALHGVAWKPGGKEVWYTGWLGENGFLLGASDLAGHTRVVLPSMSSIELFDIAPDGRVLLGEHSHEREILASLAGFSEPHDLVISGEPTLSRAITRDGRAALVTNQLAKGYETYLVRADRPGAVRLSTGDGMSISPDGSQVLSVAADNRTIYVTPLAAGQGRAVPNPQGIVNEGLPAWLPDGRRFVFTGRRGDEPSHAYVCDATTGALTPFGGPGVHWAFFSATPVSPDGRFVVLQDPSGRPMRWPLAGGDPLPIPGLLDGDEPLVWSDDGAALFVARKEFPIPVSRIELATGRRTSWLTITPRDPAGLRLVEPTLTANGRYWTLSTSRMLSALYLVSGLR